MGTITRETFYIKGMCCARCVSVLRKELSGYPLRLLSARIGEVELEYDPRHLPAERIQTAIEDAGFETLTLLRDRKIQEVKQYVKDHLADREALQLSSLSRAVSVSPFHLSRTFSLLEGEGIKEFIIRARMELAAKLLVETDESVLDICLSVGLNSPSHFTRQFKISYGRNPLAYRKANGRPLPFPQRAAWEFLRRLEPIHHAISGHVSGVAGRHQRRP